MYFYRTRVETQNNRKKSQILLSNWVAFQLVTTVRDWFFLLPRSFPVSVKRRPKKKKVPVSKSHRQTIYFFKNDVKSIVALTPSGPDLSGQIMVCHVECSGGLKADLDHGCDIRERIHILVMKLKPFSPCMVRLCPFVQIWISQYASKFAERGERGRTRRRRNRSFSHSVKESLNSWIIVCSGFWLQVIITSHTHNKISLKKKSELEMQDMTAGEGNVPTKEIP